MSKDIETNMTYRDLMSKIDRLQSNLGDLIEDADLLRDEYAKRTGASNPGTNLL